MAVRGSRDGSASSAVRRASAARSAGTAAARSGEPASARGRGHHQLEVLRGERRRCRRHRPRAWPCARDRSRRLTHVVVGVGRQPAAAPPRRRTARPPWRHTCGSATASRRGTARASAAPARAPPSRARRWRVRAAANPHRRRAELTGPAGFRPARSLGAGTRCRAGRWRAATRGRSSRRIAPTIGAHPSAAWKRRPYARSASYRTSHDGSFSPRASVSRRRRGRTPPGGGPAGPDRPARGRWSRHPRRSRAAGTATPGAARGPHPCGCRSRFVALLGGRAGASASQPGDRVAAAGSASRGRFARANDSRPLRAPSSAGIGHRASSSEVTVRPTMRPPAALLSTRLVTSKRVAMRTSASLDLARRRPGSRSAAGRATRRSPLARRRRAPRRAARSTPPAPAAAAAGVAAGALRERVGGLGARTRAPWRRAAAAASSIWSSRSRRPSARTASGWSGEGVVAAAMSSWSCSGAAARAASAWMMATRVTPGCSERSCAPARATDTRRVSDRQEATASSART